MGGFSDWFKDNEDNLTSGSADGVLNAAGAALGLPPGTLTKITDILLPGVVDDTLGAVFANNMDFSCWGSSTNPVKQESIINQLRGDIINDAETYNLDTIGGAEGCLNMLSRRLNFEHRRYEVMMRRKSSWAGCTKKAWMMHIQAFDKLRVELLQPMINEIVSNKKNTVGSVTVYETMDETARDLHPAYIGDSYEKNDAYLERRGTPHSYEHYTITQSIDVGVNGAIPWFLWLLLPVGLVAYCVKYFSSKKNKKSKFKSKR